MARRTRRRTVAAGAVAATVALSITAFATAGTLAPAAPESKTSSDAGRVLNVGVQNSFQMLPVFVALRHHFFKRTDVTGVKFVVFTSLPAQFAALAQGQVDVAIQTIPGAVSYNRATSGPKLKVIAPATIGGQMWAVKNGSSIPSATARDWQSTVRAWKGMKIGVPAFGGILDLYTRYVAGQVGLTYGTDYSIAAVGSGAPSAAALQSGIVDVISDSINTAALLQTQKTGRTVINQSLNQGPPALYKALAGVFLTSETTIANDRALMVGFVNGLARARAYINNPKNKNDILDLMTRKIGLATDLANYLYTMSAVPLQAKAKLNSVLYASSVAAYSSTGVLARPIPTYGELVAGFAR